MNCLVFESAIYSQIIKEKNLKKINFFFAEFSNKNENEILKNNQFDIILTKIGINLNSNILKTQKKLKFIVTATTGIDHIDVEYCFKNKIEIISLKNEIKFLETISTTAEHAWTIFLCLNREFFNSVNIVKVRQDWDRKLLKQRQVRGDKVGIIGLGRLGKMIGKYSESFGLNVYYYDIKKIKAPKNFKKKESLDELIKEVDHLFLTANFYPGDKKIIAKNNINRLDLRTMINVSRGELVDEEFICQEISCGHLLKYGTDVLNGDSSININNSKQFLESSPIYNLSREIDSILITPHCAGYAYNVLQETRLFVFNKLIEKININL
tara:strand:+ start:767 stop:1741 length:975 start_codon:yes stop_codon:yes gene_type:complete